MPYSVLFGDVRLTVASNVQRKQAFRANFHNLLQLPRPAHTQRADVLPHAAAAVVDLSCFLFS
jgi:hypothetical protein